MNSYLLTWNPERWKWDDLTKKKSDTANGKVINERWSCGMRKRINVGDRVFLVRVGGKSNGIVASGHATSEPYPDKHWDEGLAAEGKKTLYINCRWEHVLNPEVNPLLPVSELKAQLSSNFNWTPQAGGVRIPIDIADRLEEIWAIHIGLCSLEKLEGDEELSLPEGEVMYALVRHHRRESFLRKKKLKESLQAGNGRLKCKVPGCGFDFYEVYGELGREFAHVHHLKPLGDRTEPTATKLSDLAIVCANCHAMIHKGGGCRPLEGLIP